MKKKRVKEILIDETKRMNNIKRLAGEVLVLFLLTLGFVFLYFYLNKVKYIPYTEDSNLEYRVNYKDNEFFEDTEIASDKQYIASLIDNISANFKYRLDIPTPGIEYRYQYKIVANINVFDNDTKNSLYTYSEDLIPMVSETRKSQSSKLEINKDIVIDYNKYNELIKRFVTTYDLDNATAILNVDMDIKVLGTCDNISDVNNDSVVSLSVPLTKKTMGIDITYDLLDTNKQKLLKCQNNKNITWICLVFGFIFLGLTIMYLRKLIMYVIKTRSAETIYEKELNKILNNYKGFIQKVNNSFDLRGYNLMKIDTFTDMLEIRETLQSPILMLENKDKDGVYFLIPGNGKIMYTYNLKITDIRRQINKDESRKKYE